MNKKSLVLLVIALCVMASPAKILANVLDSIPIAKIEKSLPYPKTTKVIPASAMEYDSIAQCFVVRDSIVVSDSIVLNDSIVGNDARTLSTMSVTTKAAYAYNEDGVLYEYFGDQLSSENMDEMKQILESWDVQFK